MWFTSLLPDFAIPCAASKIVFTNGSQDPWRHASKQKSSEDSEPSTLYCIVRVFTSELPCSLSTDYTTVGWFLVLWFVLTEAIQHAQCHHTWWNVATADMVLIWEGVPSPLSGLKVDSVFCTTLFICNHMLYTITDREASSISFPFFPPRNKYSVCSHCISMFAGCLVWSLWLTT